MKEWLIEASVIGSVAFVVEADTAEAALDYAREHSATPDRLRELLGGSHHVEVSPEVLSLDNATVEGVEDI